VSDLLADAKHRVLINMMIRSVDDAAERVKGCCFIFPSNRDWLVRNRWLILSVYERPGYARPCNVAVDWRGPTRFTG
jgi:hypothetical protein